LKPVGVVPTGCDGASEEKVNDRRPGVQRGKHQIDSNDEREQISALLRAEQFKCC
jgi:hypothetical protein